MSEYPVHCAKCGNYLGYRHCSEWSDNIICTNCYKKEHPEGRWDYDVLIPWEEEKELGGMKNEEN